MLPLSSTLLAAQGSPAIAQYSEVTGICLLFSRIQSHPVTLGPPALGPQPPLPLSASSTFLGSSSLRCFLLVHQLSQTTFAQH